MESHFQSILKAVSWRTGSTAVTFAVALTVSGNLDIAVRVGLLDTIVKIGVFYLHERLWHRISFGQVKPPEYQI